MDYKEPATLYYMDASSSREENLLRLIEERRNSPASFSLNYSTKMGELFMAMPREVSVLQERVLRRERKVSKLMEAIPGIAGDEVLRSLAFDEVISSNSIENIHSTRRQIEEALKSSSQENVQAKRFREFARLYLELIAEAPGLPSNPADIRAIYDRVMDGERLEHELDGELFRKGEVFVTDGMRTRHVGILPEERIVAALEAMLALMGREDVPKTISALASHYIFEYAHPFYDGNGRTGRYLLSLFLEEPLSKPTALSLSRVIAENKAAYYRAFESVEDPLNHGEMTFFVKTMLEFVFMAQEELLGKFERAKERYDLLCAHCAQLKDRYGLSDKEESIVFIMAQQAAFGMFDDIAVPRLAELLGLGRQQTRKYLASLEEKHMARKVRGRNPVTYALTKQFAEAAFPEAFADN